MGHLFSKDKSKRQQNTNQISEQDKAILQIKQQRDKVKQFQKRLVSQLEAETEIIKQLVQQNQKPKALLLLRKKKYTETILGKTDNELLNIENLIMDIEFKKVEENVLKGIQVGNETLKQLNAVFSIEKIESILEETEEGVRKQQEISDLISGYKAEEDDAALDQELEDILDEKIKLPDVPESNLPAEGVKSTEKGTKEEKAQKKVALEA